MNTAQQLVAILLETGEVNRVCASCQKEFGVRPGPNDSHGYCRRHAIQMWQQAAQEYPAMAQTAQQNIAKINARQDEEFPPDLAQQQHAAVAQ